MGTFVFGFVIAWTGNSRLAVVNLLAFFIIGLLILWRVNLPRTKPKLTPVLTRRTTMKKAT